MEMYYSNSAVAAKLVEVNLYNQISPEKSVKKRHLTYNDDKVFLHPVNKHRKKVNKAQHITHLQKLQ